MHKHVAICLLACLTAIGVARAQEYSFVASSYLGGADYDDSVVGARIQSDGTIVLAANLNSDAIARATSSARPWLKGDQHGCVLRLSPDGRKVQFPIAAVGAKASDLAIDARDNLYVATADGVVKLSAKAEKVIWQQKLGKATRVDASADGHVSAIVNGDIVILDPSGKQIGKAKGRGYTCDVCLDQASKTVIFCGFRNAKAFDGKRTYPVQICYIRGLTYAGEPKWTSYDWSTDRTSDRFLNKPTNNMADSRADRCCVGADGKLYVTFQVAGGNHLFRYSPKDIMRKVKLAGGDKYHQFYNSRAEHKNFVGRFDPKTGEFLCGQQLCGRLSSGRANAVVTKEGDITADEAGRVYFVGKAAYGLPLTLNPDKGDYTGGGFVAIYSPDMAKRLLITRPRAGKGSPHAVAARTVGGKLTCVFGGGDMPAGMFVKNAVDAKPADTGEGKKDPKDAFFCVLTAGQ